ncbi:MAG: hypothetical protein U0736_28225, partial [Gemmataceae bacterium]
MPSWIKLLRTRFLRPYTRRTPIRRNSRLGFECLEDRAVPAVTIGGLDTVTGQVTFTGDNTGNTLILARVETYPGSGISVLQHNVTGGGLASSIDLDPSKAGDQTLTLGAGTDKNIVVNLGNGANALILDTSWNFNHKVTLTGGSGTDELIGNQLGGVWQITDMNTRAGTLGGSQGVVFSSVETLTAGSGTDTLQGENAARTWNLDVSQAYTDGSTSIAFSGFETLQGGSDVDTFAIQVDTSMVLKGGEGSDAFVFSLNGDVPALLNGSIDGQAGSDTLDYTGYGNTDNVIVSLSGLGTTDGFQGDEKSITGNLDNINAILAGIGKVGEEELYSYANSITGLDAIATWTVGASQSYATGGQTLALSNMNNLVGGSGVDTYNVSVNHTGNLDGQGGGDVFNLTGGIVTGDLIGDAGDDHFNFDG